MRKAVTTMKNTPYLLLGAVAVVGALTLSGCVNPVDAVVDRVLEGQGVDIDQNDGKVTIEGEDGESYSIGGTEVPEDFPAELPLPASKPTAAMSGAGNISMSFEGVAEEEVKALSDEIEALGYERTSDFSAQSSIMRTLENEERTVSLIWDGSSSGALIYGVTVKG